MSAYTSLKAKATKPASTTSSSTVKTTTTSAAKTIADYKADYAAARARGDAVGMKAANDGANAIRAAQGLAAENASADIASVAAKSVGGVYSALNGPGTVSKTTASGATVQGYQGPNDTLYYKPYTNYTGTENSDADRGLMSQANYDKVQQYKQQYADAQARGDSAGMAAAHQAAEAIRAQYGYTGGTNGGAYNVAVLGQAVSPTNLQKVGWTGGESSYGGNSYGGSAYGSGAQSASGSGSAGSGQSGVGYSDYLQQLYQAKIDANLAALQSAYEKNMNALNAAGDSLPAQYQSARNQAAGAAAVSQRNFNQYASAAGLNAGAGAQAQLANQVALQNNLNQVNLAEQNALSDLELQRTDLSTEYQNAIVQAKANGDYELADALYQESVRVEEALQAQQQYLSQLALQQQQFEADQEYRRQTLAQSQADADYRMLAFNQSKTDTDYDRGLELAQYLYKTTGDPSGLAAYGYNQQQLNNLRNQWAIANGVYNSSGSGSGSGSGGGSGYDNGGLTSEQIRELQSYYGVTADGLWGKNSSAAAGGMSAAEAWNAYQGNQSGGNTGSSVSSTGNTSALSSGFLSRANQMAGIGADTSLYNQVSGQIQLGAKAQGIANSIAQIATQDGVNQVIAQITSALNAGTITQAEADYLAGLLGY